MRCDTGRWIRGTVGAALVLSCGGGAEPGFEPSRDVSNPTGDCRASNGGGRVEHAPDVSDVYLRDCEQPLSREYYRVFVQTDGTAYMFPRPDGQAALFFECTSGNEQPLRQTLDRYSLCQEEAFSAAQVDVVNAMDPADALAIAHVLHERLVFVAGEGGVRPYAFPGDILDLCRENAVFRAGPMKERCDFELEAAASGARNDIGWSHTGEQGAVLADALNALYGIGGSELCDRLTNDASLSLSRVIEDAQGPCTSDADCIGFGHSSLCHDACGRVIAASHALDVRGARAVINGEQCMSFERADCTLIVPPCVPPGEPVCLGGVCGETY